MRNQLTRMLSIWDFYSHLYHFKNSGENYNFHFSACFWNLFFWKIHRCVIIILQNWCRFFSSSLFRCWWWKFIDKKMIKFIHSIERLPKKGCFFGKFFSSSYLFVWLVGWLSFCGWINVESSSTTKNCFKWKDSFHSRISIQFLYIKSLFFYSHLFLQWLICRLWIHVAFLLLLSQKTLSILFWMYM